MPAAVSVGGPRVEVVGIEAVGVEVVPRVEAVGVAVMEVVATRLLLRVEY